MVGEVFERDSAHTAFFIGGHKGWDGIDTTLDSVFDFALWNASLLVFTNKAPVRLLRDQLKYDALYPDPSKVTVLANNHDTTRFLSLEGAMTAGAMMHVAFVLSVRGTPQLYAGEEIAMEGKEDPDNRRIFPARAFTSEGRTPKEREMFDWTRSWIRLRREQAVARVLDDRERRAGPVGVLVVVPEQWAMPLQQRHLVGHWPTLTASRPAM